MISAPTPTRAEASDVANAVLDGSSAVMLSAETASGSYPVETVKMMKKIIMEVEPLVEPIRGQNCFNPGLMLENAVSSSAVNAAELLKAKAIVAFTQTGATALSISKYRSPVPVIGASPDQETLRRASIYWGVEPMEVPEAPDTDTMSSILEEHLLSDSRFSAGDLVILTAGTPFSRPGTTNMMKIVRLGGIEDIPGDGVATPFFRIELDQSCCNICGTCEKICPAGLFRSSNGAMLTVPENGEKCLGDKLCEKNCPTGAIKLLSLDAAQRTDGKKD
jgi:NAD-dependent dihydropyrimidine dehydrogenase PreA subunit